MENFTGTLKIRNPKTLQKWIDKGWYQQELQKGYIFNIGCGRFKTERCQCAKCRKSKNSPLKDILEKNGFDVKSNKYQL